MERDRTSQTLIRDVTTREKGLAQGHTAHEHPGKDSHVSTFPHAATTTVKMFKEM